MPRRPETHAKMDEVEEAWNLFDHDAMVDKLVESVEWIDFDDCESYKPPAAFKKYHHELEGV
jgi:thiamine biosynthesis protein ThiI